MADDSRDLSPGATMRRETAVRYGPVPDTLDGYAVAIGHNRLGGDAFLLREPGVSILYRKGDGVTVQLDDPAARGTMELFLAGSVHSAIAALNGLLPLHASAVEIGGCAVGFAGPSGAGKSTTAASLRQRGYRIVADDTLVIDMAGVVDMAGVIDMAGARQGASPMCLPGHKRLKLWPDALEMTGLAGTDIVAENYRKFFATDSGSDIDAPLPLAGIVVLDIGDDPAFAAVRGAARIAALDDEHYSTAQHAHVHGHDRAGRLTSLAALANRVAVYRFTRPRDPARHAESIDLLAGRLAQEFAS
ncbi:hypothetical protein [Croceicoccus sp. BE223]|uniref:hypothetical protein n=1 Tax=Croceicoccus sp. BE223 TaxID=2817716 RepID=UPI0028544F61|nr:hypothetical protein [Croceicoccus sp. BE223]MDR7100882.1 hypothetical protein [Croceicoccus sp. BE223]